TSPVEEVLSDGVEGVLFDFFEPLQLAERALAILHEPEVGLGGLARRKVVESFDYQAVIRPRWLSWLGFE
ncbi:MAG: hypothetical protein H6R18_2775, partial [Proteobacteria bacterium]|nr:hypothetical protein [Pseudomonadota bacterium]